MNLKFHNPNKLGPTDIGDDKGYRLLLVTETRQDATHWWDGEMWVKMKKESYDKSRDLYDSVTYRTNKPLSIPKGSGTPIPKGTIIESGDPKFWVDENILQSKPLTPEVAAQMMASEDKADAVLNERAQSYGKFIDNARIARSLKAVVAGALLDRQDTIPDDMAEALDVILSKIARIVSGTEKGWHDQLLDIEGYARLVRERIEGNPR